MNVAMNEVRNIIIGFQLGRETSQICYYDRKQQEPISLETRTGSNLFEFPTVLYKEKEHDKWYFGLEAKAFAGQNMTGVSSLAGSAVSTRAGDYIESLYRLNEGSISVAVDNKSYEPWELLAIFIRESLSMLGLKDWERAVSGITVTAECLTEALVMNLKKALSSLSIKQNCWSIQNYGESFFYYVMAQKPELRQKKVALLEFYGEQLCFREMKIQSNTKPILVTLSEKQEYTLGKEAQTWDETLYKVLGKVMAVDKYLDGYASAYLTGDGFEKSKAVLSIPRIAKAARKIFGGNNLFAKGACYAAKEKTEEQRFKEYLYLGEDLIRTNVGMEMLVHGTSGYYPLIKAGTNWYDASCSCEFILDKKDTEEADTLTFLSSKMEGGEKKLLAMELPNLPKRPNRTTRLRLEIHAVSANKCSICVTDMGFGELFPSTGQNWTDIMDL